MRQIELEEQFTNLEYRNPTVYKTFDENPSNLIIHMKTIFFTRSVKKDPTTFATVFLKHTPIDIYRFLVIRTEVFSTLVQLTSATEY